MDATVQSLSTAIREGDRRFFSVAAIANALFIVAGFSYSTYARLELGDTRFGGTTLTTLVRVHATVSAAWTILLIVQARLIAGRSIRLHRRLGFAGTLLAAALVVLGWIVAVSLTRRNVSA